MFTNEKGNTLITVLLTTVVFLTIGLALVSGTINGSKRTEVRKTDIHITYDAVKAIDQITTDLSIALSSDATLAVDSLTPDSINSKLKSVLPNIVNKNIDFPSFECINIADTTGDSVRYLLNNTCKNEKGAITQTYKLDESSTLTRALEIIIVTKTPNESDGYISRTIRKKIIISPMPSFLKYVAGTKKELVLNGSPNFIGNVYANILTIHKDANYELGNGTKLSVSTPLPSIHGDIYSNSPSILPVLVKQNFYNGEVPALKNDSQFADINFDEAFRDQVDQFFTTVGFSGMQYGDIGSSLKNSIINQFQLDKISDVPDILKNQQLNAENQITSTGNLPKSAYKLIDFNTETPLKVPGTLIVSNTDQDIQLKDLYVNGDLYVYSNKNISLSNIVASGNIYLENSNGNITINGNIYAANSIVINNSQSLSITGNLVSANDLSLINSGNSLVQGNLLAGYNLSIESSHNSVITGNMFSGSNMSLKSIDSSLSINGTLLSNGNFTVKGNNNDNGKEDDEVIFDSVVYANGAATISNVNILGANQNQKELILLSKGKLMITRMNEFNNYTNEQEVAGDNGLPPNSSNIKPLQAFFYTEQNAELYGVGSLFYINGGIFSAGNIINEQDQNNQLIINAIRGSVKSIDEVRYKNEADQQGHFSRFIVNYDKEVLLRKIDALPKVKTLTLYSDDLIIK
ncbi:hypothetical protein [Bacillus sp. FJAT-49736]|uniref:hypothetical protein n=1 Tax=Bacillus sp. FJAT-49736 TaxID=2833582 RepID=UPI001BC93C72|nr:hypothetical protein [Bacillus sp. FJAT-49736]MBS4173716.1 hypothetical protein [Bacillus sp. FJAT-49736]